MILDGFISRDEEIRLLNLVFSKHPKSGEAWAHRYCFSPSLLTLYLHLSTSTFTSLLSSEY